MASSVVSSVAQQLGKLLAEEAKTLYKVKDKIESLQVEMQWMHSFLKDADTKQDQERVRMWLSQIRDIAYDTEDVIEKYVHKVSQHRQDGVMNTLKWFSCILCTSDVWTLHNLGSDIDDLKTKISELTSRLQTYGIQSISPTRNNTISEERRTYSYNKEDVVGFEAAINEVMDQLVNENVSVVGISGIGGLGKTTLARKVFNHPKIRDWFSDNCVWVYISKEFNNQYIFQEIFLGLEKGNVFKERKHGDGNEDGLNNGSRGPLKGEQLVGEIHKLLQVKKCLIVLDDIWTVYSWERLKPAFESIGETSSKIILTTRTQSLLQHVELPQHLHIQQRLTPDDSWKLLQRKALKTHGTGCMMAFSPGSFSQLRELRILVASELEKLEIGGGALPNLQRLELYRCDRLKMIPDGLPLTVHIECESPCIPGIEKYNTCPHFKPAANPLNPMAWLR